MKEPRGICVVCQKVGAVTGTGKIRQHLEPGTDRWRAVCAGSGRPPRQGSVADQVTIEVPSVPYPGATTDAQFFRSAAWKLRNGYDMGGSNLRATVAILLDRVATALDGEPPSPGGRLS